MAYCKCCGYPTIEDEGSYDICPVCYWEDDPLQGDNWFCSGGANKLPLVIAKYNYEKFGATEERFLKYVQKDYKSFRDHDYKTSDEIVKSHLFQMGKEIELFIEEEEYLLFNFFIDNYFSFNIDFSKQFSESILMNEKCKFVWSKLSVLYFKTYNTDQTRKVWSYLNSMHHNSWDELQEILREFG